MKPIDPKDDTNQKQTEELLKKSRAIRERTKATIDKLFELKVKAEELKEDEGKI